MQMNLPARKYSHKNKLYIITTANFTPVKIGVSIFPEKRLKALQGANWVKLLVYKTFETANARAFTVEAKLHEYFTAQALSGEWFDITAQFAELKVEMMLRVERLFQLAD